MEFFFYFVIQIIFIMDYVFFFPQSVYLHKHEHMIVENVHVINSASPNMSDTVLPERS